MTCPYSCSARVRLPTTFFFTDTATTEIYTLSLHDALPIWGTHTIAAARFACARTIRPAHPTSTSTTSTSATDRKSTRLNSSHGYISYAVFCLKKKKADDHATMEMVNFIKPLRYPYREVDFG